ncbi:cupin domain-containing protein [Sinanaerobacter chloroacetimidivorans]|uniref:DUF861 domain-containing protein n=1 Tax=Sinanaerobacter chloroacetimidivorans TaxID=2818044 RepID=A0A8J8B3L6_9FIRM|nr:cupin domain-containing protein [Sinanaerobacter chloroacetimidivorans]MBR0599887.1 DUF861 domain-containing protein [Sinanaerobacter chloroacetimidivorans]
MKTCISLNKLRELSANGNTIYLDAESILSPSAKDYAREKGLVIFLKDKEEPIVGVSTGSSEQKCGITECRETGNGIPVCEAEKNTEKSAAGIPNAEMLKNIITKVILEQKKPICPNPIAMKIEGDKVIMEPFTEAPPGQKIGMTDVITEREGNLGAGFMTFEKSELPWTLSYDEVDYVVEGEFTIKTGGKLYTMKPGDVFHIPKGTSVVFGSPSFCKVFYVVYPANWLSQNK